MFKLVLFVGLMIAHVSAQTADYCAYSLCSGRQHIACGNTGVFSATCASDKELVDISSLQSHIVAKHNNIRNSIASGSLSEFSPAVRMATMQWDNELASLATLNVKQCVMQHDQCRNTDRFKWSGQNLAWYWSIPVADSLTAIDTGIDGWYNEKQYASMTQINSYTSTSPTIGHFTPMVNDRNTRVGCALLRQSKDGGMEYFFACNYAQTNILNRKVYESGPTASKCTTGTNPAYPALCADNEPINANLVL